jgi:hypothetical protein
MTTEAAPDADLIWRIKVNATPTPPSCGCTFETPLANTAMPAQATFGDHALACLVPLEQTPATGFVFVLVNGAQVELGGLAAPCYFSGDGGATARTLGPGGNLQAGDQLFWNESAAGWALAPSDRVTFDYFSAS